MATATAALLSRQLLLHPIKTLKDFSSEMYMVLECHKERRYMAEQNKHLVKWIPIAIPFTSWHVSPPPFGHALYGYFPILAPVVLKFYDSLSGFTCPRSYILRREACRSVFPQLDCEKLKYCAVFYEAQHNDARTNLCIALSAAQYGADICNYVEMTDVIRDANQVVGIMALDRMTGKTFPIRAHRTTTKPSWGPLICNLLFEEPQEPTLSSLDTMSRATYVTLDVFRQTHAFLNLLTFGSSWLDGFARL
jgi:glycerol-3-phosphate dehydrogenase